MNERSWASALLSVSFVLLGCESAGESPELGVEVAQKRVAEGASPHLRRCGDFISESQASSLGLDGYEPGKHGDNLYKGVICSLSPVTITIFMASQYPAMVAGAKKLKELKTREDLTLGQRSYSFSSYEVAQIMFVGSTGKYAFGISGEDEKLVERSARLLAGQGQ